MTALFLVLFLLQPTEACNLTTPIEEYISIGKELATQSPPSFPYTSYERFPDSALWVLMDSFDFSEPLMNSSSFALCNSNWNIAYSISPETLSTLAQLALSSAPLRFHNSLIAVFHRLDTLQDFYAQLILDAPGNCIDEVT
ncbi:hypothetical protein KAX97_05545, partial [candidate division WOR-3 bacterium]|nr:hypothetical protein [candidate division WOR-3 bacterium]